MAQVLLHGLNIVPGAERRHSVANPTKPNKEIGADKPPRTRSVPPTLEDVKAYCLERKNDVDAERFLNIYSANGWNQGHGKPIVDWKAAVRTWERQTSVNAGKEVRDHVNEKILF